METIRRAFREALGDCILMARDTQTIQRRGRRISNAGANRRTMRVPELTVRRNSRTLSSVNVTHSPPKGCEATRSRLLYRELYKTYPHGSEAYFWG